MYFAVIGEKKELAMQELKKLKNINQINEHIISFETDSPEQLNTYGSIIKWGTITHYDQLETEIGGIKILGCNKKEFAIKIKKKLKIKRFKTTTIINTDREVREKGNELIKIGNFYGLVKGYQDIPLYEKIDFEKPARSMQMGMMPSKLTHIMLNIGLQINNKISNKRKDISIYDPFAGSGTTCFLANYFGYESVGSDIKTQFLAENLDRRKTQDTFTPEKRIQVFNHDIFSKYTDEQKHFFINKNVIIITEGRLGPIVNSTTTTKSIQKYQHQVKELYTKFLLQIKDNFGTIPMIFTIPYYLNSSEIKNTLDKEIQILSKKLGRKYSEIKEVYAREKQQVGRKITILS